MAWMSICGCTLPGVLPMHICGLSSFKINTSHEFQDHSVLKSNSYESESEEPQQKMSPDPN